jgi:hypothetical protein
LSYAIDVMDDLYFFFLLKRLAYYFRVNCEIIWNFNVKMETTNARDEDVPMTKGELVCARFDITGYSRGSFISLQPSLYSNVRRVCNGRTQPTGETQGKISLLFFFFIPKTREGIKEEAVLFSFAGLDFCCGGVIRRRFMGRRDVAGKARGRRRLAW